MHADQSLPSPCQALANVLQDAINEWVQASEATRKYAVTVPQDLARQLAPLHPQFFGDMQAAFEQERIARERYIRANNELYKCMERHGLIE